MPLGKPIQVRLQDDELRALDEYRRTCADPPTRSRAGRELICRSLKIAIYETSEPSSGDANAWTAESFKRRGQRMIPIKMARNHGPFDDRQILSFKTWCLINDLSPRTGRRILASDNGPRITQISARRIGVTYGDNRVWQEFRARGRFQKKSEVPSSGNAAL